MQQTTLVLDDPKDAPPQLELPPEREQQIVALMAEAILAVMPNPGEKEDDER